MYAMRSLVVGILLEAIGIVEVVTEVLSLALD